MITPPPHTLRIHIHTHPHGVYPICPHIAYSNSQYTSSPCLSHSSTLCIHTSSPCLPYFSTHYTDTHPHHDYPTPTHIAYTHTHILTESTPFVHTLRILIHIYILTVSIPFLHTLHIHLHILAYILTMSNIFVHPPTPTTAYPLTPTHLGVPTLTPKDTPTPTHPHPHPHPHPHQPSPCL